MADQNPLTEEELRNLNAQLISERQRLEELEQTLAFKEAELDSQQRLLRSRETESESGSETRFRSTVIGLINEVNDLKLNMGSLISQIGAPHDPQPANTTRPAELNTRPMDHHNLSVPRLSFKDVLDSIPTFDGESKSVLKFIRACKRAREMFPPHLEPTLTRLLRNKLRRQAYTAFEDDSFTNIKEFTERLKEIFGSSKTINEYRGELGNITKNKNEHIIDYISRVKDLHTAILEEEATSVGVQSESSPTNFEAETLECFLAGLPPDFRTRLKLEGCSNLALAYANAVKIEKEIEKDQNKFEDTRSVNKGTSQTYVKTIAAHKSETCEHCNRKGHKSDNCWSKYPDKRPNRTRSDENRDRNQANKSRVSCDYCSKIGHTTTQCYKKQNDEKRAAENEKSRSGNTGANRTDTVSERLVRTVQTANETSAPSTSN